MAKVRCAASEETVITPESPKILHIQSSSLAHTPSATLPSICVHLSFFQTHVGHLTLQVASMSNTSDSRVILSANRSAALWTASSLHGHAALADCELMTILTSVPMSGTRELKAHRGPNHAHLLGCHGRVEGAVDQEFIYLQPCGVLMSLQGRWLSLPCTLGAIL